MLELTNKRTVSSPEKPGVLLRLARLRLGYTQQMLADFTQLSISSIERAERGENLRPTTVYILCQYFGERYRREVTPDDLGLSWKYRV